jgi:hypothetical protein
MGEPQRLTNLWAFMACYRDSFTFFFKEIMAGKTSGKMTWREIQTKLGNGYAKYTEKKRVK